MVVEKGDQHKCALITFVEQIIDIMDNGDKALSIFLDVSKAFDCVNHELLLNKSQNIGLRNNAREWFNSYVKGKQIFVEIKNSNQGLGEIFRSNSLDVVSRVPQGSILGPALFLIYINHLSKIFNGERVVLYANDTSLICSGMNSDDLEENANQVIKRNKQIGR